MKSKGAYQFVENEICHTVVRGETELDKVKIRKDWEFGEIFNNVQMIHYTFEKERGIVKHVTQI